MNHASDAGGWRWADRPRFQYQLFRIADRVLAEATIGYGIAKLEQELSRGLVLAQLIEPNTGCNGIEVIWEF